MISNELKESGNIKIINFNPWRFSDENSLLKNFFSILAEKVGSTLETKKGKFKDFAEKYAGYKKSESKINEVKSF